MQPTMIRVTNDVQGATAAFAGAADAMRRASQTLTTFGETVYAVAERHYLQCHARLPGGRSSARLRKKRRDLVLRWFWGNS